MKLFYCLALILICSIPSYSQLSIGPEVQLYPTGIIPGLRIEKMVNDNSAINFRIGYQWIRHRDLGVHEDEKGSGYGFSLGYRRYFSSDGKGFSLSLRTDVWWNSIDWRDNIDTPPEVTGKTDIIVIQPTLLLEDAFRLSDKWTFTPSIGIGYEWNASTEGEPTGEGAILLVGISLTTEI